MEIPIITIPTATLPIYSLKIDNGNYLRYSVDIWLLLIINTVITTRRYWSVGPVLNFAPDSTSSVMPGHLFLMIISIVYWNFILGFLIVFKSPLREYLNNFFQ